MPITVPYIEYEDIAARAVECFREHNPSGTIPVPIEDIIDVGFALNVVLAANLETRFSTVAYISHDLTEIRVDKFVIERQPYRLNFSLAHELAHLLLHEDIYKQFNFSTPEEWKTAMGELSDSDYRRLEWQADKFAGLLLIPTDDLRRRFGEVAQALQQVNRTFRELDKPTQDYAILGLAKQFGVSTGAIWFRLYDEGII